MNFVIFFRTFQDRPHLRLFHVLPSFGWECDECLEKYIFLWSLLWLGGNLCAFDSHNYQIDVLYQSSKLLWHLSTLFDISRILSLSEALYGYFWTFLDWVGKFCMGFQIFGQCFLPIMIDFGHFLLLLLLESKSIIQVPRRLRIIYTSVWYKH